MELRMVEETLLLAVCVTERISFAASVKEKREKDMNCAPGVSLAGKLFPP